MLPRELRQYTNRSLFIVLGSVIAVAFIATTATVFTITALLVYRAGAQNHNNTRVGLEMLLTSLSDAETGQRGYLLTGDPAYLSPYNTAIKQIPGQLSSLGDGSMGPTQHSEVTKIISLTHDKLAELQKSIVLRQAGDVAGAQAEVESGKGQDLMNQLRTVAGQIQAQEATQLDRDRTTVSNLGNLARDVSIVSLAATLALMLLVYWVYVKAIQSERRLDRAKDEFVALASHQLRTPATGIKSILATLVSGDFGPLNDKQTYFMKRALESNERELGIIEELLNVAKADAGRLIMHSTDVELSKLIDIIVGEQHAAIEKKNQNLAVKLPSHPVRIVGDEEKLYMAIGNLLDNARKYTPEEGKITVSVASRHGDVYIEVADSGIGITPEEVKHIFDRFHRASEVMAGSSDGAGLGLYLAGRIAELHEGTIEVSSKLGKGTKFVMILPQGEPNVAQSSAGGR